MIDGDIGYENGVRAGREGGPAGCDLACDGGFREDLGCGIGVGGWDGNGGCAEGSVGRKDILGMWDECRAEERGGAGGRRSCVLRRGTAAVHNGEHGEEAGVILCGVPFDGCQEHGLVLVEEDLGDSI